MHPPENLTSSKYQQHHQYQVHIFLSRQSCLLTQNFHSIALGEHSPIILTFSNTCILKVARGGLVILCHTHFTATQKEGDLKEWTEVSTPHTKCHYWEKA